MTENKKFKQALFIFKICYLVYLLLAFNAFINGMVWMNVASYVITAAGLLLVLCMVFQYKRYRHAYNLWILGGFVLSYAISAMLHLSYGVSDNLKGLIWLVLPLLLGYITAFDLSRDEISRELKWLSGIYIVYCTIANFVSLTMVYWGRRLDYTDGTGMIHSIGYRWNRLWGIYDDPNHGATITVIAMFLLIYLFYKAKNIWKKVLAVLCFLVNYLYVVLSNSRTGVVSLTAGILVAGVLYVWMRARSGSKIKKLVPSLLCVVLAAGILFAGTYALNEAYQPIDKKIEKMLNVKKPTKPVNKPTKPVNKPNRKKDLQKDYSNGRFEIWKNGLQIVEKSPVVGIGYRNIVGYSKEHFPEGYLVKNASGVQYDSMHNLELDVLVSQGILGGVLLLILLGNTCVILLKRVHLIPRENTAEVLFSVSAAGALFIAGTFLSFIFYVNTPQNLCFWLFLGYAMRFCQIGEKEKV